MSHVYGYVLCVGVSSQNLTQHKRDSPPKVLWALQIQGVCVCVCVHSEFRFHFQKVASALCVFLILLAHHHTLTEWECQHSYRRDEQPPTLINSPP